MADISACVGVLMKTLFSTRSGENDVEYSGIMELEEGEISYEVIGATGDHLLYFSAQFSITLHRHQTLKIVCSVTGFIKLAVHFYSAIL